MPSFALSASGASESAPSTAAAVASKTPAAASASTSSGLPWTPARRDSFASTYSCGSSSAGSSTECGDSSDEDEAVTPPVSPDLVPSLPHHVDRKGKGKELTDDDAFHLAALDFSLAEIAEDDEATGAWIQPIPIAAVPAPHPAPSRGTHPLPTAATTVRTAFKPDAPDPHSAAQAAAAVRPAPQPSPPESISGADDEPRGRSRWPRLLWRSELDVDSLVVLKDYHERAIGEPLPVLKRGMRPRSVARWSRRMEDAGL